MSIFNDKYSFGWLFILFHWVAAIIVIALLASGLYSDSLPDGEKNRMLLSNHATAGTIIILLMVLRFIWRMVNQSPAPVADPGIMTLSATLVHFVFYIAIIVQGIIGISMAQLNGNDPALFGFVIPQLMGSDGALSGLLGMTELQGKDFRFYHKMLGRALAGLVVLHILGAFTHHFVFKDDTLRRMWFTYKPRYTQEASTQRR